jgi:uncharacterized repeat protein (TIGR01451 family)
MRRSTPARSPSTTSTATARSIRSATAPSNPFHAGTTDLLGTVRITDLEASEQVILRVDVRIGCDVGAVPTGNLQAAITGARVFAPAADTISVGNQTVPFKQVGEIANPQILVDKSGDTLGKIGDAADYTFTITNTGNVPLYPQSLTDTLLGALNASSFVESITDDNVLQVGETWTLSTTRVVQPGDPDPLPNTFTAVFDTAAGLTGDEATHSDSHELNLFQPNFTITKIALDGDGIVTVGDTVQYQITITNTSSSDSPAMDPVSIIDTKIGALAASAFVESGTDDNVLELGETWTGTFNYLVLAADFPSLTNVVTATFQVQDVPSAGFDGKNQLERTASQTLQVDLPALNGRMTGGGSVFLTAGMIGGPVGTRVTHGFQLHCTTEANNRLEINWGKPNSHFHLNNLTWVKCEDTPLIQAPPNAPIDTLRATGTGVFSGSFGGTKYSKAAATVEIVFRDAGERGDKDTASYKITLANGVVVLNTDSNDAGSTPDELLLQFGNHQAHNEIPNILNAEALKIQSQIDLVFSQLDNVSLTESKILSLTTQLLDLIAKQEALLA